MSVPARGTAVRSLERAMGPWIALAQLVQFLFGSKDLLKLVSTAHSAPQQLSPLFRSLEAVLSTAALSLWPLRSEKSGRPADGAHPRAALALAAAAVLIRPTAAVQWALLGSLLLCCCACVCDCVRADSQSCGRGTGRAGGGWCSKR